MKKYKIIIEIIFLTIIFLLIRHVVLLSDTVVEYQNDLFRSNMEALNQTENFQGNLKLQTNKLEELYFIINRLLNPQYATGGGTMEEISEAENIMLAYNDNRLLINRKLDDVYYNYFQESKITITGLPKIVRKDDVITLKINVKPNFDINEIEQTVLDEIKDLGVLIEPYEGSTLNIKALGINFLDINGYYQTLTDDEYEWIVQLQIKEKGNKEIYLEFYRGYAVNKGREIISNYLYQEPIIFNVREKLSETLLLKALIENWFFILPVLISVPILPRLYKRKKK